MHQNLVKQLLNHLAIFLKRLKELGIILGTGILGTNLIYALNFEDEILRKIKAIFNWTTKNWKALAIAGGVIVGLDIGFETIWNF